MDLRASSKLNKRKMLIAQNETQDEYNKKRKGHVGFSHNKSDVSPG